MDNIQAMKLSQTVSRTNNVQFSPIEETQAPQKIENGDDKLKKALIALGVIAAGTAAVAIAVKTGKSHKLTDINFNKGIASLPDGTKFSGKIKDTLQNGDKIVLKYKDGIIQSSTRTGEKAIQKTYETVNSERIVNIVENGVERKFNLTKTAEAAKKQLAKSPDETLQAVTEAAQSAPKATEAATEAATKAAQSAPKAAQQAAPKVAETAQDAVETAQKATQEVKESAAKATQEISENIVSDEQKLSQELANADAALEYATGKKANISAKDSARAFFVKDESSLLDRIKFLKSQNEELQINPKNFEALKSLKKETVASLSDEFLKYELTSSVHFDGIKLIEQEFTPAELNKITRNFKGRVLLRDFYSGISDTNEGEVELLKSLHKMAK